MGSPRGDELRGGSGSDYLWISEQMICKTGVATRNAAYAAGRRSSPDNDYRTFDQVVHEFAHTIDQRYGLDARVQSLYANAPSNLPSEEFAWAVQTWFSTPEYDRNQPGEQEFLEEIFTSRATYNCAELYQTDVQRRHGRAYSRLRAYRFRSARTPVTAN